MSSLLLRPELLLNSGAVKPFIHLKIACEQAPSEVGKKIRRASRSVVTPRAKRVGRVRTPSSPDRSRLVPLALDYDTRLSHPKPNREPVRRLI